MYALYFIPIIFCVSLNLSLFSSTKFINNDLGGVLTATDKNNGAKNPKISSYFFKETINAVTKGKAKSDIISLFLND